MKVEDMITFLRKSVYIQDPQSATQDKEYLSMTDEELLNYLNVVKTSNFADVPSLALLPDADVYGLIILAKKELYYTLAVKEAPLYDMGADNNNYLKRSQRFDHYMKLIEQAGKEYSEWLETGGEEPMGTVRSYHVTLSDRYNTRYNYENATMPKATLYLVFVTDNSVEVSWTVKNISRFFSYKVFISNEPIVDLANVDSHISDMATCVKTIKDIRQTALRITGLNPDTQYYVALQVTNMASLKAYAEQTFTTESEEGDD